MKIRLFKKEFPLVALVLLVIGIGAGILAFNYTSKAIVTINSDQALRFSYDDEPDVAIFGQYPKVGTPDGQSFDYYFRSVPEPTPLVPLYARNLKTKELPESSLYDKGKKSQDFYGAIKVGEAVYKYDIDSSYLDEGETDWREIRKGRTAWLLSYFGPKALGSLTVSIVSTAIALANFKSYKKGYVTKRNVTLIKLSASAICVSLISFFVAKGLLLIGVFGTIIDRYFWADLLIGSILPTLFILAAMIGLTHIICQNMRNSIVMKEEIDGTV